MSIELDVLKEPSLYDLFNSNCVEDMPMYYKMFSNAEKVLELGIGTGRIALPLIKKGIKVVGVDNSKEMLSYLKSKIEKIPLYAERIKTFYQDFCFLNLEEKFDFAFYPFCTFNYLLTLEQQEKALASLKPNLTKKAIVIFDLMTINTFPKMLYDTQQIYSELSMNNGKEVAITIQSRFNQSTQIYTQNRIFKYYNGNDFITEKKVKMMNRIFFIGEFELLLEKCGYKIIKIYGDYNMGKFTSKSECLIIEAALI